MKPTQISDVFAPRSSGTLAPGESDVTLRDGGTLRLRPIQPADERALCEFYRGLSVQSRSYRFHGGLGDYALGQLAREHSKAAESDAYGVIAVAGSTILAHAMYVGNANQHAEVAFAIADAHQRRGLGTILLAQLAAVASARGFHTFEASILPENHQMVSVFRDSGFAVHTQVRPGEIRILMPTEVTQDALERFEQRDGTAAVNAVRSLLCPASVALVGASRERGTIGGELLHNLLAYGFQGPVFPVNRSAAVVQSVLAYATIDQVPGPVDLAVIAVPAEHVLAVAEGCAKKGVRNLVVISAGFGETDVAGRARQDTLMRICRDSGMRLVGPNCMGILNTDPKTRLNATFGPITPPTGGVALMSQSGALGLALMQQARVLGLGVSSFVSVGNKADLSGNDLIQFWEQDPATNVILLYLESFGNPRKFSRIARRVARTKPIVAVKSGRSAAGARATASHTGALVAASDVPVDALFRQAGVIRTETLAEMFDVAALLSCQQPPKGKRVAILSNAGGPAILCADACSAEGLELPELGEQARADLAGILPLEATTVNPVDMIASASAEQYREAMRIIARDPNIDALIVIFIPPLATRAADAAGAIVEAVRSFERPLPVLTVFMQATGVPAELQAPDLRLPSYAFPENAAIALAHAVRYGEWLARPVAPPVNFDDIRRDEAAAAVAAALAREEEWLSADAVRVLLGAYGIPLLQQTLAGSPEEASRAAADLGADRIALKAVGPALLHKTEAGAVRLALLPADVLQAAESMKAELQARGTPASEFLLQPMAGSGVEMIVGMVHDERFGPIIACGAGGTVVELLKDVAVRLSPLSSRDASEMLRELKTFPLLTGYRGSPPRDVAALESIVLRLGLLADDLPQVIEIDLNPVIVHERGATVVDARVRIGVR